MFNITFQQMAMFLEVAKKLNITAVAEEMYISQTALSKTIHRLEANLEFQLFERSSRGLKLTPQGKLLYSKIQVPFESICNSIAEIHSTNNKESMLLRIGFPPTIDTNADYAQLNKVIRSYMAKHPEISFQEGVYNLEEMKNMLRFGDLDLIFIQNFALYGDENGFDSEGVLKFKIFTAVGENNPAIRGDSLNLEILRKQSLLTIGYKSRSDSITEYVESVIGCNLDTSPIIQLPNLETIIRRLKNGNCFAVLGKIQGRSTAGIKFFDLSDTPYTVTLHAAWRANDDNPVIQRFIKSIINGLYP